MRCARVVSAVMILATWCVACSASAEPAAKPEAEHPIVLENAQMRLLLGNDAAWKSIIQKSTGKDYCVPERRVPFATARIDGKTCAADEASFEGGRLTIGMSGCDTRLVYEVDPRQDWIAFRLESVSGPRPSHMTLMQLAVTPTEHGGPRLNAAWDDDDTVVCLRSITMQAYGTLGRRKDHTMLSIRTQDAPGPKLEGGAAALLLSPLEELKPTLSRLANHYDLVRNEKDGVGSRDLPMARRSYLFLSFSEAEVDKAIECCDLTGIRQIMLSSGAWCASVGHYTFKTNSYPDGMESLKRTVAKLHDQGILVGMHTFSSKVSKRDPYVSPVPSRDFVVDMRAELAEDIDAQQTEIRTATDLSQWPGSPVCKRKVWEGHVSKHQEVIIDDEIIRYDTIGPEGKWNTFVGCKRGSWGTKAAAHSAGVEGRHYAVDGCINGYITDQDAPLFQKTTSRLADIFNECDFDMIYFDGSEDVDRSRYHYYAANAHATVARKIKKRPFIHQGGGFHHNCWHSFTRTGTIDQYPGTYLAYIRAGGEIKDWPTCKDHIDRSVRRALQYREDLTPAELGWFGLYVKNDHFDGLQLDEIEYLMTKSLALDAPISLQTSHARLTTHALSRGILEIVRYYEQLRLADRIAQATLDRLLEQGKDFVAVRAAGAKADDPPQFVEVTAIPKVGGSEELRAMVGTLGDDALATLWHYQGREGKLTVTTTDVRAEDFAGQPVEIEKAGGTTIIPFADRRITIFFPNTSAEAATKLLVEATAEMRKPEVIWIQAEGCHQLVGSMTKGSTVELPDDDALGDFVVCDGPTSRLNLEPRYAEYRVQVPCKATWTLWGRVRYPTGGDMSFGLVQPGEEVTLSGKQVLGNCGTAGKAWHWTGRGGGSTSNPPGSPIRLVLEPGEFVFRIYPREGPGSVAANPRLDCLCLCEDPSYVPNDDDARKALETNK